VGLPYVREVHDMPQRIPERPASIIANPERELDYRITIPLEYPLRLHGCPEIVFIQTSCRSFRNLRSAGVHQRIQPSAFYHIKETGCRKRMKRCEIEASNVRFAKMKISESTACIGLLRLGNMVDQPIH
jgi:hypothetical protein